MKKNIILAVCFILILSFMFSGCSDSLKNENLRLNQEMERLNKTNTELQSKVDELNNKIKEQDIKISKLQKTNFNDKESIFPIFSADIDTYETTLDAYVYIPKETALEIKLQTLANVLSEVYFDGLPIQVKKIVQTDNKKIAVVNLHESPANQGVTDYTKLVGKTWTSLYMQGSAGGTITSRTLIETFLQRQYKGQWIDGVQFLYEDAVCDYEHAPDLAEVNYR